VRYPEVHLPQYYPTRSQDASQLLDFWRLCLTIRTVLPTSMLQLRVLRDIGVGSPAALRELLANLTRSGLDLHSTGIKRSRKNIREKLAPLHRVRDELIAASHTAAAGQMRPARASDGSRCVVLLDRHVHKNGGTAFRVAVAATGGCAMLGGAWDEHMARYARDLASSTQGVACSEAHERVVDDWAALARPLHAPCRTVIVWRVRRPDVYYASFYRWAQPPLNFSDWFPRDLQAATAMHDHNADLAQHHGRAELPGLAHFPGTGYFAAGAAGAALCRRALAAARAVDLLWPTEQMGSLLRAVSRKTGLGSAVEARLVPEGAWWRRKRFAPYKASVDDTTAARLSRLYAGCDWQLYELALQRSADPDGDASAPVPMRPEDLYAGEKTAGLDWRGNSG
tara:strand:- start:745 stop:1932 length:1188 start_codon:yes stop_codon:yes gene_type:complete